MTAIIVIIIVLLFCFVVIIIITVITLKALVAQAIAGQSHYNKPLWYLVKVFKNGPSRICLRQPLKYFNWYGLLRQTISLQIF